MQPHSRWNAHNRRTELSERVIHGLLAFALLLTAVGAITLIAFLLTSTAALLRYTFGA